MNGEDVPRCVACDRNFTGEHILIECGDFLQKLEKNIMMLRVYKLFQETSVTYVFDFLHEMGLVYRL